MGKRVGISVESAVDTPAAPAGGLALLLLGPLRVMRDGVPRVLPASRKVRALLACLAMAPHALSRSHLCELLWDLPNDPRGELRWSLSKLRTVLDTPQRLLATDGGVRLDLAGASVDALQVQQALQAGIGALDADALRALAGRFRGEFLEGLEIPRSAGYSAWLTAQRRRFRAAQVALLEGLAQRLPRAGDEALACLEQWLRLAPFDARAHEQLFEVLAATGRWQDGEAHLATAVRQHQAEGADWAPLGLAWRAARQRHRAARVQAPAAPPAPAEPAAAVAPRRASIAVMPFAEPRGGVPGGLGGALAHDLITRLAKLRSMFVIAPGTVFVLDERRVGAEDAARRLEVDYVAGGTLRRATGGRLHVGAQLLEARSARVLWAEDFDGRRGDTFAWLDEIGDRIVAAIASQVELAERQRAILKPPESLDAWEAHHRGLWHMMRFSREDNLQARRFFEAAVRLDPGFARPYAGLSFTHFQEAFLGWGEARAAMEAAYRIASQGVMADERDPSAHWALGRAQWLRGQQREAIAELEQSVDLSPNFAHGHYTLAFVQAQSGDAQAAIAATDHSRRLSPYDPLLFAMLATRAIALMRLGRHDEAADWALEAAARPNAHVHILSVALHCLVLAGRHEEARRVAAAIQRTQPGYGVDDYLRAFHFGDDAQALIRRAAAQARRLPA